MNNFFKDPFLLDGATGTELQKRGLPLGSCCEMWELENPAAVIEVQRGYVEAGSDAIIAPTFSANRVNFKTHGVSISVREACLRLVEISRKAAADSALVVGDMAPTGLMPEPYGESSLDEMTDVFSEQAGALEEAGVDFFIIETQMFLDEALSAVKAVKAASKKPVCVSFSPGPTGKSLWGEEFSGVLKTLQDVGIDAFGLNCCGDLSLLVRLMSELKPISRVPLLAMPNAGAPEMADGRAGYHMTPEHLAAFVPKLREAGASIFGGCCGTNAAHIKAIRAALV